MSDSLFKAPEQMLFQGSVIPGILAHAKKVFLVVSGSICSGKSTVSANLSSVLNSQSGGVFYADKDVLSPMTEVIFGTAGIEVYDRQSDWFYDSGARDVEYFVCEQMALRGMLGCKYTIVNCPYTAELRDEFSSRDSHLRELREAVHARGGILAIVFLETERATVLERLMKRKREEPDCVFRTPKIYEDIDAFLDKQNLKVPQGATVRNCDVFLRFDAAHHPAESFKKLVACFGADSAAYEYDPNITTTNPFMAALPPYLYTAPGSRRPERRN